MGNDKMASRLGDIDFRLSTVGCRPERWADFPFCLWRVGRLLGSCFRERKSLYGIELRQSLGPSVGIGAALSEEMKQLKRVTTNRGAAEFLPAEVTNRRESRRRYGKVHRNRLTRQLSIP